MKKHKYLQILLAFFILLAEPAFTIHSPNSDNLLPDSPIQAAAPPAQDHPEWEEIIKKAFQSIGVSEFIFNKDLPDFYLKYPYMSSAMGEDAAKGWIIIGLGISPKTYEEILQASDYTKKSTTFHSYSANILTTYDIKGNIIGMTLEWQMDGLFYWAGLTQRSSSNYLENVTYCAEALYDAARGGSSSAPAPRDQPSEPQNLPSEPQNLPGSLCSGVNCKNNYCKADGSKYLYNCACDPDDGKCYCKADICTAGCDEAQGGCLGSAQPANLCSGVNCKNNYCKADGSKYLYNCACDPDDGKCYCKADICKAGCDEALGGCRMVDASNPDDLCAHTVCSPDHCGEDGKTRYHDCKCDPADGECYCYTEVCREGCNAESGKCVEMEGPCAGVECEARYCSDDGASLNYNCACDPDTGACACRTEPCPAGCDPDTLACIQDLCVDVECPDKCENNVSSKGGHCDAATGECVYDQVTDCGLAGCQENSVECKLQSDLSIEKITVLQAVEGGTLIYSKPTAVVVKPGWLDPSHNADASVTLLIDGKPFSTLRQTVKANYSGEEKKVFNDIAVFHIPTGYLQAGTHEFQAEAVLMNEDQIDGNLENNSKQVSHNFIYSPSISLMFGYYRNLVDEAQVWSFYNKARVFLLNVFPITGVSIQMPFYDLDPSVIGAEEQVATLDALHKIHNSTPGKYARYAVGLFRDGGLGAGKFGASYAYARQSVLVGDGSSNPHAHETLAHELGHELFGDEYDVYIGSSHGKTLPKDIYIYNGQRRELSDLRLLSTDYYNIMGLAGFEQFIWVNRETWDALARHFGWQSSGLSRGPIVASPPALQVGTGSGYLLTGSISPDDQVVVQTLLPFEEMAFEKTYAGEYWVQVFKRNGKMAGEYTLEVEFSDEDPSGSYFVASVPADLEDTGELRILHGEKVIWKSAASESAPSVAISAPAGAGPLTGSIEVSWQAEDEDGDALNYTLLYSVDDGGSWTPLATGLESTAYTIDFERLPGGSACCLRVIASDGWHAAAANTETAFAVEDKPAKLVLEQPQEGAQFEYGQAVEMNAFAYDTEAGWIDGAGIDWQSSRDGELGSGNYLTVEQLSYGEHTLTARLEGEDGQPLQASVNIVVARPAQAAPVGSVSDMSTVLLVIPLVLAGGAAAFLLIRKRKGKAGQAQEQKERKLKKEPLEKREKVEKKEKKGLAWWVIVIIVVLGSLLVALLLFLLFG